MRAQTLTTPKWKNCKLSTNIFDNWKDSLQRITYWPRNFQYALNLCKKTFWKSLALHFLTYVKERLIYPTFNGTVVLKYQLFHSYFLAVCLDFKTTHCFNQKAWKKFVYRISKKLYHYIYAHFVLATVMKLLCSIKYLVFSNVLLFVLSTLSTNQLLKSLWCRLTRLD